MSARRISALLEVLGVYVIGQYVVALFVRTLLLEIQNPLTHINPQMTGTELLFAARDLVILILMQYGGWFLLIIPLNWWHRGSGPVAYGLTKAGQSSTALVAAGIAAAALSAWPQMSVQLLYTVYHLSPTVQWWQIEFEMFWRRWEFWLLTVVVGWFAVAFLEELFFRGYCQRRLAEDWGDSPAILGVSCLFAFSHAPYASLNLYGVSTLAAFFLQAIGLGVVFAWTRSLVPCVVAHAIISFPMTPFWQALVLTAFVLGTALLSRRGIAVVKQVFAGTSVLWCFVLVAACAAYSVAILGQSSAVYVAAVMLGLAVGLEAMQRETQRPPTLSG